MSLQKRWQYKSTNNIINNLIKNQLKLQQTPLVRVVRNTATATAAAASATTVKTLRAAHSNTIVNHVKSQRRGEPITKVTTETETETEFTNASSVTATTTKTA